MTLRRGSFLLSLLPLVITALIAIPEIRLQLQVHADTVSAHHADLEEGAAREIGDGRILMLLPLRRWAAHDPTAAQEFAKAAAGTRAAIAALDGIQETDPIVASGIRRVSTKGKLVLSEHNAIAAQILHGSPARAASLLVLPANRDDATALQADVRDLVKFVRGIQRRQFDSFDRLWHASIVLLILAIAGMALSSLLLWYFSRGAVNAIVEVGDKTARSRRGEPLGPPSGGNDEIAVLDAAVHAFVVAQELRESQLKRYRLLADVTHDIILFIDRAALTIVDANTATLRAYGYTRSELIGKPTAMLHAAEDPIDAETIALSDRPEGLSYEGLHERADGSVFPVEVHARTAEVEGRLTIVKTIRDISERRHAAEQILLALDEAVEAARLKGEFVATMSHEIRTPMHGVIGMSELLLETQLLPIQREYAVTVKESAQALLTIIDDVLDFSKLEANKIELELTAFDPAQLVASAVNLVRGAARDKGLSLRSHSSAHVPSAVRGDPTRVRQVLINLIGNAVKFTATGEVRASVSLERDDGRSLVLAFAVSDSGIGVAPESRERLFEAFVQGDGSMTRRFGGTGLGLSISRRLVELMGGEIWLADHEGPGSTFCFTARFERTAEAVVPVAHAANALRVLVLDDNVTTRSAFGATLSSWGMRCELCGDVDAARASLRTAAGDGTPFDVVLIDAVLPRNDGLAFASELGIHAEYGKPARILIAPYDAAGRKSAALAAGCAAYLTKPVDPSDLYDALSEVERKHRANVSTHNRKQRRARILMADDSPLIRRVARHQLEELQYGVDIVENGALAVAAVATGEYELVLMDMRMPEMDGLRATMAIREAERTSGRHIVIVALTANVLDGDREKCVAAGMDDFLAKPLKLDALHVVLKRWLPEDNVHG
jgi:PAS domain S-box-containing protein